MKLSVVAVNLPLVTANGPAGLSCFLICAIGFRVAQFVEGIRRSGRFTVNMSGRCSRARLFLDAMHVVVFAAIGRHIRRFGGGLIATQTSTGTFVQGTQLDWALLFLIGQHGLFLIALVPTFVHRDKQWRLILSSHVSTKRYRHSAPPPEKWGKTNDVSQAYCADKRSLDLARTKLAVITGTICGISSSVSVSRTGCRLGRAVRNDTVDCRLNHIVLACRKNH